MTGNDHFTHGSNSQPSDTAIPATILSDDSVLCTLLQHSLALCQSPRFSLGVISSRHYSARAMPPADLVFVDASACGAELDETVSTIRSHLPESRLVLLLDDAEMIALSSSLAGFARSGVDSFLLKSDLSLRQVLAQLQQPANTAYSSQLQTPQTRPRDPNPAAAAGATLVTARVPTEPPQTASQELPPARLLGNDAAFAHALAIDIENERIHLDVIPGSPLCDETDSLQSLEQWYERLDTDSAAGFRSLLDCAENYKPIPRELNLDITNSSGQPVRATLCDIQLKNNGQGRAIGASATLLLQNLSSPATDIGAGHHAGFDNLPDGSELIAQDRVWQNIARSLPMLCLLLDEQGYIVRVVNTGNFSQQLPTEFTPGIKLAEALDIESLDALGETISRTLNTGKPHQQIIAFPTDSGLRWLDTYINKLRGDSLSRQVLWTAFDVTSNRHDYQELLKNHDALAQTLDDAPFLFFQKDNAGRFLRVNKAFCETFDLRADEISGLDDKEVFRERETHFVELGEQAIAIAPRQEVGEFKYSETVNGSQLTFHWRTLVKTRQSDNQVESLCGFGIASKPGTNEKTEPEDSNVSTVNFGSGLTMSGALKQDFKVILSSLVNYAELALSQKNPARAASIADHLSQVESTAHRTRELLLEKTAGKDPANIQGLELKPIIEDTVEVLRPTLPNPLAFDIVYSDNGIRAQVDEASIRKIVMLLLMNAKTTAESGTARADDQKIRLTLESVSIGGESCIACEQQLDQDFISLTVQTAAAAFDETALDRLVAAARQSTQTNSDDNVIALTHRLAGHAMIRYTNGVLALQLLFNPA